MTNADFAALHIRAEKFIMKLDADCIDIDHLLIDGDDAAELGDPQYHEIQALAQKWGMVTDVRDGGDIYITRKQPVVERPYDDEE